MQTQIFSANNIQGNVKNLAKQWEQAKPQQDVPQTVKQQPNRISQAQTTPQQHVETQGVDNTPQALSVQERLRQMQNKPATTTQTYVKQTVQQPISQQSAPGVDDTPQTLSVQDRLKQLQNKTPAQQTPQFKPTSKLDVPQTQVQNYLQQPQSIATTPVNENNGVEKAPLGLSINERKQMLEAKKEEKPQPSFQPKPLPPYVPQTQVEKPLQKPQLIVTTTVHQNAGVEDAPIVLSIKERIKMQETKKEEEKPYLVPQPKLIPSKSPIKGTSENQLGWKTNQVDSHLHQFQPKCEVEENNPVAINRDYQIQKQPEQESETNNNFDSQSKTCDLTVFAQPVQQEQAVQEVLPQKIDPQLLLLQENLCIIGNDSLEKVEDTSVNENTVKLPQQEEKQEVVLTVNQQKIQKSIQGVQAKAQRLAQMGILYKPGQIFKKF